MSVKMKRVMILGMKSDLQEVVNTLQHLGSLQFDEIGSAPDFTVQQLALDPEMVREQEGYRLLTAQIDGLLDSIRVEGLEAVHNDPGISLEKMRVNLEKLRPDVQELNRKKHDLQSELETLPRYAATLEKLLPLMPETARHPDYMTVGVLIGRTHQKVLDMVSKNLIKVTNGEADYVSGEVDSSTRALIIVFPRKYALDIEELLGQEDITRLRLPTDLDQESPDAALASLRRRMAEIPTELQDIDRQLKELGKNWQGKLLFWKLVAMDRIDAYAVMGMFGETEQTFVCTGWIPEFEYQTCKEKLIEKFGDMIHIDELAVTDELDEQTPVMLDNPGVVEPYELLVKLLSTPKYNALDPSGLMAVFFPLFFGMMLGDVGYGTLLFIASLILRGVKKTGMVHSLTRVLMTASVWTILFGILFGEVFGTLGERFGLHALWFDRSKSEHVSTLLLLAGGIGAAHITLGLILGVWEAYRERSRNHLLERGGMLVGLVALFLLAGVLLDYLPEGFITPSVAALVVGIVLLGVPMGRTGILIGPIEFIGVIGNVLSYLRIAAIGLASVYLAKVANDIGSSVGSLVIGVIIAVLIHSLNLVMGAFSPAIHSLRLHYVEFFRKFYEGGGRPYEPFHSRLDSQSGQTT